MDKFPKNYEYPSVPDLTLNQFRAKLPVKGKMELDKLIKWQYQQELASMNYNEEVTRKFFEGTLKRDPD